MNGIVIVDKPQGWTSQDVTARLRRVYATRRIGHGGTLDPMATGVLPVFVGRATRGVEFFEHAEKTYETLLLLGRTTDTQDVTGTVLAEKTVRLSPADIEEVLPRFRGDILQVPPMYSALKVNGKKLYELARKGQEVERQPRPITVFELTNLGFDGIRLSLRVRCSKGTYIRTLLEDIAAAMGQKGTMSVLRRTSAGVYTEADAHTLEEILAAKEQGMDALEALMLPVESVFESLPLLVVEPWVEQHLYNGCPTSRYPAADGRYRVRNAAGQFLGLANIVQGVLRVEKLFVERN